MVNLEAPETPLKHFWVYALAIGMVAMFLHATMLWNNTPIIPKGDEPEYITIAEALNQEGRFRSTNAMLKLYQGGKPGDPTAYRSPVLPLMLVAHFKLFGSSLTYPRITLILLSSLTCVLLAFLGRNIGYPLAGLVAGAIWALWPPALFGSYSADRILNENLAAFFLVGSIILMLSFRRAPAPLRAVTSGLLLGLAVLTRGYLLFLLPMAIIFIALWPIKRRSQMVLLFTLSSILVPGVWVIRNWSVMGKPVLSTQTDHFYLGNNSWARGSFVGDVLTLRYEAPQIKALIERHPNYREMTEMERSEMWSQEAMRSVTGNPARFIWLLGRKSLLYLAPTQTWARRFYRWHYPLALILPFFIAGIWITIRRGLKRETLLLLLPVIAVYLATLLTYALDRYRFPIEPFIVLLGAIGIVESVGWLYWRTRKTRRQESQDKGHGLPQVSH